MKQLALLFVIVIAPFFAKAQHKFHQKISSAIVSLAAYRPTLHTGIDFDRVKKKTATVKKRLARAGRRYVHATRVRKQSKIRLYANIGFNTRKLARK